MAIDHTRYLETISGRRRGARATVARGLLAGMTPCYGTAMMLRDVSFRSGLSTVHRVSVPVISVGNITTGGTGKTPVVAWIVNRLAESGHKVGIVSRGYRSLDGQANDEKLVLERLCPAVPHVQHPDRVAAARQTIEEHQCDVLVLDDAFQHRRLHRDVDLVLIDAICPWGYGHLLPRGLLREPKSALRRAAAVLITRVDQVEERDREAIRTEIARHTTSPVAEVLFRPKQLINGVGETDSLDRLTEGRWLACCGIGNPAGFRRTLEDAGLAVDDRLFRAFADHHHYSDADVASLAELAQQHDATDLVTTLKDLVKLAEVADERLPFWALGITAEFTRGEAEVRELLARQESPGAATPGLE